jgi:hypothetical protein
MNILLTIAAVVCFILATIGAHVGVDLIALGLAFFAAGHLPIGR